MTYSFLAVAGLGFALGTSAVAQEERAVDQVPLLEVAPGSAIQPLGSFTSFQPVFVLMHGNTADSADIAALAPSDIVGTSGLLAFSTDGVRLPRYETEIPTGTVPAQRSER